MSSSSPTATSKAAKSAQLTREEELLLQTNLPNVSTKSSALFYGNAAIVAAIPICNYSIFIQFHFKYTSPMNID
jgi:hypothetical protein